MDSKEIAVESRSRNQMIDITSNIQSIVNDWKLVDGCLLLFVPHTTAAVTINEHADATVQQDILLGLSKLSPERAEYRHLEGNSDAHLKSSMIGCSEPVLVRNGRLQLGTWQGIFFCEFDGPRSRRLLITKI
jgi:secondary thiamine-phosphate synthase enzyme